jgi:hypothetical protein
MVAVAVTNIMLLVWMVEFGKHYIGLGYDSRLVRSKAIPVTDRGGP